MPLIVFIAATAMVLAGAIGVIASRHPVHSALSLILTLFGVAVHFVSMEAHFLAVVQVIVYAGAIVVLFLFVIMLLGVDKSENLEVEPFPVQRPVALVVGLGTAGLIIAAIVRGASELREGTPLDATGDANIVALARNLFSDYVFAFEFTSILLIVAVAGTILLTRKEKGGSQ